MMQQNQMIDPATSISITMQAGQWDQVLNVLGDGAWKVVAPLIQKIVEQAQAAAAAINSGSVDERQAMNGTHPLGAASPPPPPNGV